VTFTASTLAGVDAPRPLTALAIAGALIMKRINFGSLPIGAIFWWGAYHPKDCNWGRKRSSRTADYRPRLSGTLCEWTDWGYWPAGEAVYWEPES